MTTARPIAAILRRRFPAERRGSIRRRRSRRTAIFSAFFGSPSLNVAEATVQTGMAVIDHDFENGLTVRNGTIVADYKKFYQNVYPAGGALSGAVDPTDTSYNLGGYQHWTNRDNICQPDRLHLQDRHRAGASHRSASAPNSAGRPASISATPACSRMVRPPESTPSRRIRSRRPISDPSPLSTTTPR